MSQVSTVAGGDQASTVPPAILRIENLTVRYMTDRGELITPVDDVWITIGPG